MNPEEDIPLPIALFARSISSYFRSLYLSTNYADVIFQIRGEEIPAHKIILSRIPFYKRLFASEMKEALSNRITIDASEETCFKQVLKYIYCGKVPDDLEADPLKYLPISDMKEIDDLKGACLEAMKASLSQANVVKFLIAAEDFRCPDLKKECFARLWEWKAEMPDEAFYPLKKLLSPENIIEYLIFAAELRSPYLKKKCFAKLSDWKATAEIPEEAFRPLKANPELMFEYIIHS